MSFILRILLVFITCEFVCSVDIVDSSKNTPTERIVYNGFPVGIVCGDSLVSPDIYYANNYDSTDMRDVGESADYSDYPGDMDEVQCVITKNDETVFNETILWQDSLKVGVSEFADDFWNGTKISVSSKWGVDPENLLYSELIITVKDPVNYNCSNVKEDISKKTITVGEDKELSCYARKMYMSESQYNSITTVWYQGCNKIEQNNPNFEYINVAFNVEEEEGAIEFDKLNINNASLKEAPGIFSCVLERDNKQLVTEEHRICLKEPFRHSNEPTIATSQENYKVEPGSSLTISCFGQTGTESDSATQMVRWHKYNDTQSDWTPICIEFLSSLSDNTNCNSDLHVNKKYCKALSEAEIALVKNHELNDNFSGEYLIWNATESDSGLYRISLTTSRGTVSSNFTVAVEKNINVDAWIIALSVIGVFVVIALVMLLLFYIYRIPIQYIFKKCFGSYRTIDKEYVAYMVYASDVFIDMENNMLQDANEFFEHEGHRVFDPNNNAGQVGAPVAEHVRETLQQCLKAVLLVTPGLLETELNVVYRALGENIENLNMRVVFICTRNTKKAIFERANQGDKLCVMLRRFMRRQGNTVILWERNNRASLHRALYVAMPRVRRAQPLILANETRV